MTIVVASRPDDDRLVLSSDGRYSILDSNGEPQIKAELVPKICCIGDSGQGLVAIALYGGFWPKSNAYSDRGMSDFLVSWTRSRSIGTFGFGVHGEQFMNDLVNELDAEKSVGLYMPQVIFFTWNGRHPECIRIELHLQANGGVIKASQGHFELKRGVTYYCGPLGEDIEQQAYEQSDINNYILDLRDKCDNYAARCVSNSLRDMPKPVVVSRYGANPTHK